MFFLLSIIFLTRIYLIDPKTMIHPHALIYSSQEDITIGHLKQANYDPSIDTTVVAHWMANREISAVVEGEPDFPSKLYQIQSKPYIIYYQGDISLLNKPILGIVGPRKHSDFAKIMVQKVINQATHHDIVTISGLASGVDQLAHHYSLENNIPTIAVLWWGFRHFLASKDREFIRRIVDQGGLVISEFKLSQDPQSYTFPQRNRIIAGLADVLFLPEASKNSGSLITVEFAQKLQKPIYGTPNFTSPSMSEWLHEQLQNWWMRALLNIPAMFKAHFSVPQKSTGGGHISLLSSFDPDTQQLLGSFQSHPSLTISSLLQQGFSQDKIYPALARLEMENIIHQPSPGTYALS